LSEFGHVQGGLAETVNEGTQCLVSFLCNADEGKGYGLLWAVAGKMGGKKVGECVETVN